jgi:gamma-glutamyltranspeptidase/glutathione hydrolase
VADPRWAHLGIEASKLAMADRDALLADPLTAEDATGLLLSDAHLAARAAAIDDRRAARPPAALVPRGGGTIYLAVVDGAGNAVSLIQSNYKNFGSGVLDPATGILYHNRGSFFTLRAGHPNELAPGKRPLHTLLPGMLFRGGRPWVVAGSMGGDAQPQIHAQVVSALVDGGVDVATAVGAPRWFVEPEAHFEPPVEVRIEPRFGDGLVDGLRERGHPVTVVGAFDSLVGHCHAIELVDGGPSTGEGSLAAATDPRSVGLPAVW